MSERKNLWQGLSTTAQKAVRSRGYDKPTLVKRISSVGVDAAELAAAGQERCSD